MPYGYGYYPQNPVDQLLAPARRASVIMFVIGALMLVCGLGIGAMGAMISSMDLSQLPPESQAVLNQFEQQMAGSGFTLSGVLTAVAVVITVLSIAMIVVGVFVRKGGMGAAITGIILACIMVLFAGLSIFGGVSQMSQGQGGAGGTCFWTLFLGALIWLLVSLFGAAKNSGQVAAARQGQFGGMAMQQYGQPGYPPQQQQQQWGPPPPQQPGQWPNQGWGPPPGSQPPPQAPPPQQQHWPPPPPPPSQEGGA